MEECLVDCLCGMLGLDIGGVESSVLASRADGKELEVAKPYWLGNLDYKRCLMC